MKHHRQGLRRWIDYGTGHQTQSHGSVERMGGCLNPSARICRNQRVTRYPYLPHPFESYSFELLFGRGACKQFDSVIGVLSCRSPLFVMHVLDVCQACHQRIKYLCCIVTKWCAVSFASRLLRSTSLEGKNRYSTETCLIMNS